MKKVNVLDTEINYYNIEETDYISLTDMVRNIEDGLGLIEKWLRNKNTIEFLGVWEECIIKILIPPNSRELKIKQVQIDSCYLLKNG